MKKIYTFLFLLFSLPCFSQVEYQITEKTFQTGDTVRAEFRTVGFDNISAIQFAMRFDTGALIFLGIEETGAWPGIAGCFSWYGKWPNSPLKPGEIRHVWSSATGKTFEDGTHIFSVRFVAKTAGNLAADFWLWANHPVLKPLVWNPTWAWLGVVYVAPIEGQEETSAAVEVESPAFVTVAPNPFYGSAVVTWSMSGAQEAEITITDTAGRILTRQICTSETGIGSAWVDGLAPGVYALTIRSGGKAITTKIISQ